MQWFRMYADAVDDEKLRLLAFEDRWHFVALLCLKANGTLDSPAPFLERRIAVKLGVQLRELEEIKRRLQEVALIDENWQPLAWSKRQFPSDSSAERTRKWRERHRDADVTSHERHRDVLDTDTEQNPPLPPEGVAGLDQSAWSRWLEYRRQIRKPIKPASMLAAQRKLAGFGEDQSAVVEQSIAQGWTGLFPLKERPKPQGRGHDRVVV